MAVGGFDHTARGTAGSRGFCWDRGEVCRGPALMAGQPSVSEIIAAPGVNDQAKNEKVAVRPLNSRAFDPSAWIGVPPAGEGMGDAAACWDSTWQSAHRARCLGSAGVFAFPAGSERPSSRRIC
jgi:hypothetical protein